MKRRRQHGFMRPTLRGVVLVLLGCALILWGASYSFVALTATGIVLLVLFVVDALGALVSRSIIVFTRHRERNEKGFTRFLLPVTFDIAAQWEQLDQNDDVFARFDGAVPTTRGVFRRVGTLLRWVSPFGLWKSAVRSGGEATVVHPVAVGQSADTEGSAARRASGAQAFEESGLSSARPYTPGDPERNISWKITAHRGEMMTRTADSIPRPSVVIVLDTLLPRHAANIESSEASSHTASETFEQIVELAFDRASTRRPTDARLVLTDGYAWANSDDGLEHFLAAVEPTTRGEAGARAEAIAARLAEPNTRGVFLTQASTQPGTFEQALDHLGVLHYLTVVRLESQPHSEREASSEKSTSPLKKKHFFSRKTSRKTGRWVAESSTATRLNTWGTRLLTTAATQFLLISTLLLLAHLFTSSAWLPFGIILSAVCIAEGMLLPGSTKRVWLRTLIADAALILATLITATLVVHSKTQVWWFNPLANLTLTQEGTVTATYGGSSVAAQNLNAWGTHSISGVLETLVNKGADELLYQSFPVEASVYVDVAMIVFVGAALLAVRTLITVPLLRPLCVVAPIAAVIAHTLSISEPSKIWVGAILAVTALLIWACQKNPMLWPEPTALSAGVAAIALIFAPATGGLVASWNLPIGPQKGLFSSNQVSPFIELKQNLSSNSSSIALTYRSSSNQPLYLKLATLDNFNGDTWSFDGTIIPRNSSPTSQSGPGGESISHDYSDGSPLMQLLEQYPSGTTSSAQSELLYSQMTIETLQSRFLPITGMTGSVYSLNQSGWTWSADGIAFSDSTTTEQNQNYWVATTYVEPASTSGALNRELASLQSSFEAASTDATRDGSASDYSSYYSSDWKQAPEQASFPNEEKASAAAEFAEENYTALPSELPATVQQVVQVAKAQGIADSSVSGAESQAKALGYLLDFFQNGNFTYSLDAPDGNGSSNMEVIGDFLTRRTGYCVHYATSFAVLGRALGVPTRVVMGYLPHANTSSSSKTFNATNQQLHAWVEAYIDTVGWVPFDVTPARSDTAEAQAEEASEAEATTGSEDATSSEQADDTETQDDADTTDADTTDSDATSSTKTATGFSLPWQAWVAAAAVGASCVLIFVALLPWLIRRRRRRKRKRIIAGSTRSKRVSGSAWVVAWREIIDTALDCGLRLPLSASEQGIAALISTAFPRVSSNKLSFIAGRVENLRYGRNTSLQVSAESTEAEVDVAEAAEICVAIIASYQAAPTGSTAREKIQRTLRTVKRTLLPVSVLNLGLHQQRKK